MAFRFRVPHTLVLLFGMVLVAWGLTFVLPHGKYERDESKVVPGSYARLGGDDVEHIDPWELLQAVPKGLNAAHGIILFVFLVGGAFAVIRSTGAIDAVLGLLLRNFSNQPLILILVGMIAFCVGSSTIGMAEEYLPFVPILLILAAGLKLDAICAVGIMCLGYAVGYGCATLNPFTVAVAKEVAGVEQGSGIGLRVVLTVPFFAVAFAYLAWYARRVRLDPSKSLVADIPLAPVDAEAAPPMTVARGAVLGVLVLALGVLVYGLKYNGWYLVEMGAMFVALTIAIALVARIRPDDVAKTFCSGAAELTTTALLIGVARAIQVVLDEGQVVDTIVHGIAQPLDQLGSRGAAAGMFWVQSLTNLFICSGSGQAYVTMPIMAPLADEVGVSRETAVLAYQFGDGFTNIVVPTNPVLISILAMAGVPYDRWLRFVLPFMAMVLVLGSIVMMLV